MLINGRSISDSILMGLKERVNRLPFKPVFCDVLVGVDSVQQSFVRIKGKAAESIGVDFLLKEFQQDISEPDLKTEILKLNNFPNISGLIVQLPLPQHIDAVNILDAIDFEIDVDCIGSKSSELFYSGSKTVSPPTAQAVMKILDSAGVDYEGKKFLVVGQGALVGKPVSFLLKARGYDVSVIDKSSKDTETKFKEADVIISGVGQAGLITGRMIKPGAVVIDAGTSESGGGIKGDVDTLSVSEVASILSPVPGGVGPVTVAELLSNVVTSAERKQKLR